jgi:Nitroreductase
VVSTEFYDLAEKRRSIRRYKNDPVGKESLYRILEACTLAPSWSCKHCWRYIIIDDVEIKNRLRQCINDANPAADAILEAPLTVAMCADPVNTEEIDGKDYYMADCGIAMGYFMLCASNEDLATCWIGIFDEDKIKSLLNIPDLTRVVAISPLGYPDETPEERVKKGIKDIVYLNKWDNSMTFK